MSGAKNGILSDGGLIDSTPYLPPGAKDKPSRPKSSDWKRLGSSRRYKAVNAHMEARKEYFRHFTPDGTGFAKLYLEDPAKAAQWAVIASEVIKEIDDIQYRIQLETGK